MLITRFGDTYSTAYVLPLGMAEDNLPRQRSPQVQRVANADGAFDFNGSSAWPIEPLTVRKQAIVTAATWAGVDTALDALHAATIALGEQRLWAELRDGSKRWAWAKCRSIRTPDKVGQPQHCPITLEFDLREGLWYAETASLYQKVGAGTFTLTNAGDVRVPVKVTMQSSNTLTAYAISATGRGWSYAGSIGINDTLIVDAAAYLATKNAADCYSSLTITDKSAFWFYLEPGSNSVTITFTGGNPGADIVWNDAYL
jgi:hypothetical protein